MVKPLTQSDWNTESMCKEFLFLHIKGLSCGKRFYVMTSTLIILPYGTFHEICTQFTLCCVLLWFVSGWFISWYIQETSKVLRVSESLWVVSVISWIGCQQAARIDTFYCRYCHVLPVESIIDSLWPNDAIWRHIFGSVLAEVMACFLTALSHSLNQCWFIIKIVLCHSPENNFKRDFHGHNP